ncbi:STAS domain-containing protein [Halobacillus sp. K22]|uniref:STAS domain-containing protein n=1 Tax=Halobacillus sp. K22 TaxID=3457431 RepID=UPI003FCCC0A0
MKQVDRTFPLPYYRINKNFIIYAYSKEAGDLHGVKEYLLDIFDDSSHAKIKDSVKPEIQKASLEVHLKPVNEQDTIKTADMYVSWENDLYAEVLLHVKDEELSKVNQTLTQLRGRLNETNFELLEEKEKLDEAIEQSNRLSAPFIVLSPDTATIPLFGDITTEKMYAVEESLLKSSQREGIDRLLFDFTAVGEFNREGIRVLSDMMKSLFYMGLDISIIGIQPHQAKELNELKLPPEINYMHSLQQAVAKYCSK